MIKVQVLRYKTHVVLHINTQKAICSMCKIVYFDLGCDVAREHLSVPCLGRY